MTPFEVFLIPGEFILYWLLVFFQISAWKLERGLVLAYSFMLASVFWSALLGLCITTIKRLLGFGPRGR